MTDKVASSVRQPKFLAELNADPDLAFREFYSYAQALLARTPPAPMRALSSEDRRDLFHDLIYHCVRDDFRVLRTYRDCGRPFAAWLYVVAHREALAKLRRHGRALVDPVARVAGDPGPPRALLSRVRAVLDSMKALCRRLLLLAAEEYTPREMARVLDLPEHDNKRISDRLRECRRQLRAKLEQEGIDWRQYLGA